MKIFIAGAKSVRALSPAVQKRMMTIYQKRFDVIVGDCYGVDASVQKFYSDLNYNNVVVFASNGKARNNIGHWSIHNVSVPSNIRGFDFYKQKDIAMANEADYGFMIWDGKSRGTLNNIINLVSQDKRVLIYLTTHERMLVVKNLDELNKLIAYCIPSTQAMYSALLSRA